MAAFYSKDLKMKTYNLDSGDKKLNKTEHSVMLFMTKEECSRISVALEEYCNNHKRDKKTKDILNNIDNTAYVY